jgi:cell division initiation protein
MAITPIDIYNKEFDKTRKGYNAEQVDVFLDEIVEAFENLYKINISLKEKNEVIVEKLNNYRAIETALNKTLNTAESTSKDIIENASNKSELVVKEAEIKARKIMQDAEDRANNIVREAEQKTINARRENEELKRQVHVYKNRMVAMLEAQLKTIVTDYNSIFDDQDDEPKKTPTPSMSAETVEEKPENTIDYSSGNKSDEQPEQPEQQQVQPSFVIDNSYFNFQDEETTETDEYDYTLPQEKQLEGTYMQADDLQVEDDEIKAQKIDIDNMGFDAIDKFDVADKNDVKPDDYIQIDYSNLDGLVIEPEEERPKQQGYSLEDAFLELRRAAEIYKDSDDGHLS